MSENRSNDLSYIIFKHTDVCMFYLNSTHENLQSVRDNKMWKRLEKCVTLNVHNDGARKETDED